LIRVTFLAFVYKVYYFYSIWCKTVLVLPSSDVTVATTVEFSYWMFALELKTLLQAYRFESS